MIIVSAATLVSAAVFFVVFCAFLAGAEYLWDAFNRLVERMIPAARQPVPETPLRRHIERAAAAAGLLGLVSFLALGLGVAVFG